MASYNCFPPCTHELTFSGVFLSTLVYPCQARIVFLFVFFFPPSSSVFTCLTMPMRVARLHHSAGPLYSPIPPVARPSPFAGPHNLPTTTSSPALPCGAVNSDFFCSICFRSSLLFLCFVLPPRRDCVSFVFFLLSARYLNIFHQSRTRLHHARHGYPRTGPGVH